MQHPYPDNAKQFGPSDENSSTRSEWLLRDAKNAAALRHALAMIDIEGAHRLAWLRSHFNRDQPRVPAGHTDGGQWTSGGGGNVRYPAALGAVQGSGRLILSDVTPDGIRAWAQYAEAKDRDEVQNKTDADSAAEAALVERTTAILHYVVLLVSSVIARRPGSSAQTYGTNVHTAFAEAVRKMNLPGIGQIGVEQSFDKDGLASYGADGSIRTDVVLRNPKGVIIAIYDLKTGNAIIRPSRAKELRTLTGAGPDVPVMELHSVRGLMHR